MTPYRNLSGNTGVTGYEIGDDRISVQFKGGAVYVYTNGSAGSSNITQMKTLAIAGRGLGGYINSP